MNINHVIISGNLVRDPSTKFLANEKCLCSFTIANSRKYKNGKGENVEEAMFLDCTAFGRTAEVIGQYCQKGRTVILEGSIKQDNWDDKETGKKRSKISLLVDKLHLMPGGKRESESGEQPVKTESAKSYAEGVGSASAKGSDESEPPF